jgi:c-di-GMP-binding flagellar brake protein YcgR
MTKPKAERRKSPRVDARLALQVERHTRSNQDRPITTESMNISSGGVYCQVKSSIEPMTRVGLTLLIPSFGRKGKKTQVINCGGVVVRCVPAPKEPSTWELACCFTEMKKEDHQLIEEYIGWRSLRDMIDERLSQP